MTDGTGLQQVRLIPRFELRQPLFNDFHLLRQFEQRLVDFILGFLVRERRYGGVDAHQLPRNTVAHVADLLSGSGFVHGWILPGPQVRATAFDPASL